MSNARQKLIISQSLLQLNVLLFVSGSDWLKTLLELANDRHLIYESVINDFDDLDI